MGFALKLLLMSLFALLVSTQQWNNYRNLPHHYRHRIDQAITHANEHFGKNNLVTYRELVSEPKFTDSTYYVHVRLAVSNCIKDAKKEYRHRDDCAHQQKPIIECVVCKTKEMKHFVGCAYQKQIQNQKNKCYVYLPGGYTLMSQTTDNTERRTGCLGCV